MALSENAPPMNPIVKSEYMGKGVMIDDGGIGSALMFFLLLYNAAKATNVREYGETVDLAEGLRILRKLCLNATFEKPNKVILIGNGGSSAIASHMAADYSKNGGIRAIAFNDAPTLTCLGNDFGIDEIFAKQLEFYAHQGDVVIIVSSSGHSGNILRAAEQAFVMGLDLVTFSGMNPDNVLRNKGRLNFYVPAKDYGLVELAHLALLHSIVSVQEWKI
ncbi:MAG: SIS domain-containing protein [Gallionella sp.]|nr:SIS domain-containing protein [Gallionella sp.]